MLDASRRASLLPLAFHTWMKPSAWAAISAGSSARWRTASPWKRWRPARPRRVGRSAAAPEDYMNTLIRNGNVVTARQTFSADILIEDEVIKEVRAGIDSAAAEK